MILDDRQDFLHDLRHTLDVGHFLVQSCIDKVKCHKTGFVLGQNYAKLITDHVERFHSYFVFLFV
ncbi:hypothetical protein D3C74_446230 [compost metagenome]